MYYSRHGSVAEMARYVARGVEEVAGVAARRLPRAGEVARAEWVPLGSVPGLVAAGEVWNGGSLVALLRLLTMDGQAVSH